MRAFTDQINPVLNEFAGKLRLSTKKIITIPWPEFYRIFKRDTLNEHQLELFQTYSKAKEIIVGYGHFVVVIASDFNFAPQEGPS